MGALCVIQRSHVTLLDPYTFTSVYSKKADDMVVNTIHWFRKGLRLHDNPSLRDSIQGADTLRCIYILDPWYAGSSNVGINRWRQAVEGHVTVIEMQFKKCEVHVYHYCTANPGSCSGNGGQRKMVVGVLSQNDRKHNKILTQFNIYLKLLSKSKL